MFYAVVVVDVLEEVDEEVDVVELVEVEVLVDELVLVVVELLVEVELLVLVDVDEEVVVQVKLVSTYPNCAIFLTQFHHPQSFPRSRLRNAVNCYIISDRQPYCVSACYFYAAFRQLILRNSDSIQCHRRTNEYLNIGSIHNPEPFSTFHIISANINWSGCGSVQMNITIKHSNISSWCEQIHFSILAVLFIKLDGEP